MGAGEGKPPFSALLRMPSASSPPVAAPQVRPHPASPLFKCGRTRDIFHVSAANMWGNLRECPFGGRDLTALASALAGNVPAGTRCKSVPAETRSGHPRSTRRHHEKNVASLTAFALGVWWVQTITVKRPWEGTLYV